MAQKVGVNKQQILPSGFTECNNAGGKKKKEAEYYPFTRLRRGQREYIVTNAGKSLGWENTSRHVELSAVPIFQKQFAILIIPVQNPLMMILSGGGSDAVTRTDNSRLKVHFHTNMA